LIRINLKTDNLSLLANLENRTEHKTKFCDNSDKAVIIQADIGPLLEELAKEY
jgi:hypothetical protein